MQKVRDWETRRLKVGDNFQDNKGMVETWFKDQVTDPGSEYSNLKTDTLNELGVE